MLLLVLLLLLLHLLMEEEWVLSSRVVSVVIIRAHKDVIAVVCVVERGLGWVLRLVMVINHLD